MKSVAGIQEAVGLLYEEACVRLVQSIRSGNKLEAMKFDLAAAAIRSAWPETVVKRMRDGGIDPSQSDLPDAATV